MGAQTIDPGSASTSCEDPLIPRASFNSDEYPQDERSNAYQLVVAGPAKMTPLAEPFYARITAFIVGPVRFHYVEAIPHRFERTSLKISMDSADYLVVQHVIEGQLEGECDGKALKAADGSVYCLNFRQPSFLTEKRRTKLHFVTVSRQVAVDRFGDLRRLHGALFSKEQAASYVRHLETVYPRLEQMRRSEVRTVVNKTLGELDKMFAAIAPATAEDQLERARHHITSQLSSHDLTPESVASALGMSRSQLYLLFRDVGGVSKYIWTQRLQRVHAALMSSSERRTLTELAIDFGFASQSHLSSLFRKVYGEAPSRLRHKLQIR